MRTIDKYCGDLNSMTPDELFSLLQTYEGELNPIERALLKRLGEKEKELKDSEQIYELGELAHSFGYRDRMDFIEARDHQGVTEQVNGFGAGNLACFLHSCVAVHEDEDQKLLDDYAEWLEELQEYIDRNNLSE